MPPPAQPAEPRRDPRTNLFVAAALCSDAGSVAVRVRNISPMGALIEGVDLPQPGARARLRRGRLSADAELVWRNAGRAGLRFARPVVVSDWLPGALAGTGQARVDEILEQLRADRSCAQDYRLPPGIAENPGPPQSPADELLLVIVSLQRLADELSAEPSLVAAHPEIQMLDVLVQKIGRVAGRLRASDKG